MPFVIASNRENKHNEHKNSLDGPQTVQPLPFEQAFTQLEERIKELKRTAREQDLGLMKEITKLEKKSADVLAQAYQKLTPQDIVKVARHPERPHTSDYVKHLIADFTPLAGDRMFADDQAIWGGMGRFRGKPVMVMGHEKGRSTETRLKHNFGSARPEGYRKAIRLMELADRFGLPILTFIDTIGAHAAVEAEERGQAQAIASCIEAMLDVSVPVIATVIGEGGSGGAIALAAANVVLMLQYAIYTVITPEACATILWRSAEKAGVAAEALKFTSDHLKKLGVVEDVIAEPPGGAHRNALSVIHQTGDMIATHLEKLAHSEDDLITARHTRFQALGRGTVRL